MAAIDFPNSPSNGQIFSSGGKSWKYNSTKGIWQSVASTTTKNLAALDESIVPSANVTYDLGSATNAFRDLYLSGSSINLGGQTITANATGILLPSGSTVGGITIGTGSGGATQYANTSVLPTSGLTAGEFAFVGNTLFMTNGSGWYSVALINQTPELTLSTSSISLGSTGNTINFTFTATDPDGPTPTVTVSNSGIANTSVANVNLYTSNNTVTVENFSADPFSATITLTASDGINQTFGTVSLTVAYLSEFWDETALSIGTSSTNSLDNSTFIDRSTNAHTVTPTGTPTQTAFHPYLDNWSVEFDGNDYLSFANDSSLDLDTGDFTIEGWWYFTDTNNQAMVSKYSSFYGYVIQYQSSNLRLVLGLGGSDAVYSFAWTPTQNTWYHVAITRSGTDAKAFINGVQIGSTTTVSTSNQNASTTLQIGLTHTVSEYTRGSASNIRIVKGTALYTTAFTPATEKLTAVSGTSLLTCQSNRFIDNSTNAHTITVNGDPKVSAYNPFGQGSEYAVGENKGSGYFVRASSQRIAGPNAILPGGGGGTGSDFTLEGWVYPNNVGGNQTVTAQATGATGDNGRSSISFVHSGQYIGTGIGESFGMNSNGVATFKYYAWNHFVWQRSGSTYSLYLNGDRVAQATNTNKAIDGGQFRIGTMWDGDGTGLNPTDGYISDIRVTYSAVYDGGTSITVPTSAVGGSSAEFYVPFDNAGIFDKTGNNILKLTGSTATSTTQTKFADTAMYFDGNSDYIRLEQDSNIILSPDQNFTVESWVWLSSLSNTMEMLCMFGPPHHSIAISLNRGGYGNTWMLLGNGSSWNGVPVIDTGGTAPLGAQQWHHVALVKNGNTITIYHDGQQAGQTTTSFTTTTGNLIIGAYELNGGFGEYLEGYLENFQVLKGVAKYTTNFTPPTATQGRIYQAES